MKRYDERDTIFARMTFKPGSSQYNDYYSRNTEKRATDDTLRNMAKLCSIATPFYDQLKCAVVETNFAFLSSLQDRCEVTPSNERVALTEEAATNAVVDLAQSSGADLVGTARMLTEFYYSHRGRQPHHYGEIVKDLLPFGVVFAVELGEARVNAAPKVEQLVESSLGYLKAGLIGLVLASFIRELGFNARNHMDANYLAILPLAARAAGLGIFGRNGLIINERFGPRVKLGLVTTDLPILESTPIQIDLESFCNECRKCSKGCPASAIPDSGKETIDGVRRWRVSQERCYSFWRRVGTDCGLCIKNCPFTHEPLQNIIR